MAIQNEWLTPLQRSFTQIKTYLLNKVTSLKDKDGNNLITDVSEGNILVLIISMFSSIAEIIHYYIDNMARECFVPTARKYSSLERHAKLVGYTPKLATPAMADVLMIRDITTDNAAFTISAGSIFYDTQGNPWKPLENIFWPAHVSQVIAPLFQYQDTPSTGISYVRRLPTTIPDGYRVDLILSDKTQKLSVDSTKTIEIGNLQFTRVNTFAYSGPNDRHYILEPNQSTGNVSIVFGDGVHGAKPTPGSTITLDNFVNTTKGSDGNVLANAITVLPTSVSTNHPSMSCTNSMPAVGGSDYESFDSLKRNIGISAKTMGVAITPDDFMDLALSVAGVDDAKVEYRCGKLLHIYIKPVASSSNQYGIAPTSLLNSVYNLAKNKSVLNTGINVRTCGVVPFYLTIDVTGKPGVASATIRNQVVEALYNRYSIRTSKIGDSVRVSDIYALIDNLPGVDYLHITDFYSKPWAESKYNNKVLLFGDWEPVQIKETTSYLVSFTSSTVFTVYSKDGTYSKSGTVGTTFVLDDIAHGLEVSTSIVSNAYTNGDIYEFTVYTSNTDLEVSNFNVPVFSTDSQLKLTIKEVM